MKRLRVSLAIVTLAFTLVGVVSPDPAQSQAQRGAENRSAATGPSRTNLPTVLKNATPRNPTSIDLIDEAIAGGQISAEEGLVYKVYAQFSDSRLPAQFVSASNGRGGDLVMEEVASQAGTLSDTAKQALTPFFVPPNDARSWYYLPRMGAASDSARAQADPAGWVFKSAAGGKVRVYYYSTNASDEAKATTIAAEFDRTIWSKLTTLMQKEPRPNGAGTTDIYLWTSYIRNNGTIVPFDANTLGITVGASCDQTSTTIYLPDTLPIGSVNSPGLIQYATHEFMHSIQFGMTIQSCGRYRWLKEATATWSEDYVYEDAQSERDTASSYLNRPTARLDDTTSMHDYGAYLLFYFLTHKVDTSSAVVRNAWLNAATTANSYKAVDDAVNQAAPAYHDAYWSLYLATLWNKGPYQTYYNTDDGLVDSVAIAGGAPINITTPSSEQITPLYAEIPTGGAMFYDLKFPDNSVRSLTIMNGLGQKLSTGDASGVTLATIDGDETYLLDDLTTPSDGQGVTVELLLKASGLAAPSANGLNLPTTLNNNLASLPQFGYCMDAQGPMDEIVVILSNADFANPDRIMKPEGLPVTVFANNVPCWRLQGTVMAMDYDNGVTDKSEGTVTFGWPSAMEAFATPYQNLTNMHFPESHFEMLSAQMQWSVSGTRGDCSYSGSESYTAGTEANFYLYLLQGLLAGNPTYRGYEGGAGAEVDKRVTTNVSCPPPQGNYTTTGYPIAWSTPLSQFRSQIKVSANGTLSGDITVPNYDQRYQRYTWNLTGLKK